MATTPLKCRELLVDGEDLQFKIDAHGAGFPDAFHRKTLLLHCREALRLPGTRCQSLKVVIPDDAVIVFGFQAAPLEIYGLNHKGKGHCVPASQQAQPHHERGAHHV